MAYLFVGYLVAHPLLQVWTLIRCRGGWRLASIAGLVLLGPCYLWSLYKVFGPKVSGDLSGLLILLLAPVALIYLGIVAMGGEADNASRTGRAAPPDHTK